MPEPTQELNPALESNLDAASLRHLTNVFDQDFESSNRHAWKTKTAPQPTHARILYHHFFRRFFDNDTLSIQGETETTVIRFLCFCAVPSLMFAFWLAPHYPLRPYWNVESDRYFFVLYSFVAMGIVATFEWEMLFPDRSDFLILLTLPLKARELFYAKGRALLTFLVMFLFAANIFASLIFPAFSTTRVNHLSYLIWTFLAHWVAVALAGTFSAFTLLAIEGLMLCLLPTRWFRTASTTMQAVSITVLLLALLLYPLISGHLQILMSGQASLARFIPPLWFLGLYESLVQGSGAPAGASALGAIGIYATAGVILLSLVTYPAAWSRQKKRALEGVPLAPRQSRNRLTHLLHRNLLRQPQQRAVFHFMSQTIARNPRYQSFLALYSGAGLALALCSIATVRTLPDHTLAPALSIPGLHSLLPLLLFWTVAGLRASFAFPVDMRARWIFPISIHLPESSTPNLYAYPGRAAKAAKTWVLLCCALLSCVLLSILLALHWSYRDLLIQAVCAASISLLLTDLLFLGRTQIPFTRPRMPGRTSLPLVFVLYAAIFPGVVLFTVEFAFNAEKRIALLIRILLGILVVHGALRITDYLAQRGILGGFPEDEIDEGPQTLGLIQ